MAAVPQLDGYFKQVDSLSEHFIERLRKAVAIPSVSTDDERCPDFVRMGEFLAAELTSLGAEVQKRPLGKQPGKEHLDLPPVVIARYGNNNDKRTILVYGHYDVQPAGKEDGWATEPFDLTVDGKGRMYGRGSTDDKGPVLGWLNVIEAHQKAGADFPVNLLMCFEGMKEYGSEGLDDFIKKEAKSSSRTQTQYAYQTTTGSVQRSPASHMVFVAAITTLLRSTVLGKTFIVASAV